MLDMDLPFLYALLLTKLSSWNLEYSILVFHISELISDERTHFTGK